MFGPGGPQSSRPSPAALGASVALGGPVNGLGPCLPSRQVHKKVVSPSAASSPVSKVVKVSPVIENGRAVCGGDSREGGY
ncbi:unnamed protein product [Eruca vesicaria subsp. sativa]|uniref:Uncharacterized protein n=1 Tax=Eruca vesicaria subsp. sativa TaxID=29727 RepID=A0ABC8M5I5_ERUVS|nr:unnamed protein product [Eruca vesicaria subsp. sativa]